MWGRRIRWKTSNTNVQIFLISTWAARVNCGILYINHTDHVVLYRRNDEKCLIFGIPASPFLFQSVSFCVLRSVEPKGSFNFWQTGWIDNISVSVDGELFTVLARYWLSRRAYFYSQVFSQAANLYFNPFSIPSVKFRELFCRSLNTWFCGTFWITFHSCFLIVNVVFQSFSIWFLSSWESSNV